MMKPCWKQLFFVHALKTQSILHIGYNRDSSIDTGEFTHRYHSLLSDLHTWALFFRSDGHPQLPLTWIGVFCAQHLWKSYMHWLEARPPATWDEPYRRICHENIDIPGLILQNEPVDLLLQTDFSINHQIPWYHSLFLSYRSSTKVKFAIRIVTWEVALVLDSGLPLMSKFSYRAHTNTWNTHAHSQLLGHFGNMYFNSCTGLTFAVALARNSGQPLTVMVSCIYWYT